MTNIGSYLNIMIYLAIAGVLAWTVYKIVRPPKKAGVYEEGKTTWFYIAISGVVISVLSLFLPVIKLTGAEKSSVQTFDPLTMTQTRVVETTDYEWNIVSIAGGSDTFDEWFVNAYTGPVIINISSAGAIALAVLAVAAVICAAVGLITLRSQRPNTWQFVMTVIGLIGTAIPSIVILVIVYGYGDSFYGGVSCGLAPFLTPAAMIVCIAAVVRRHSGVKKQLRLEMERKGMIHQGGDL